MDGRGIMKELPRGSLVAEDLSKVYRVGEPRSVFAWRAWPGLLRRPDSGRMLSVLEGVSFAVAPGECVGLMGPNGTGKSTLLRILTGITAPTTGRVNVGGRVAAVLDLGSGFYEELNARENTLLNAQLLGMGREEALGKLDEIFQFAELEGFREAPMGQFSFGMRLRLAFSIAMALEPDILLLDEVMGVGDLQFQRRSANKIRELAERGVTLLVVSHHLSDLTRTCSRGILLQGGRIRADGPIQPTIDTYLDLTRGNRWAAGVQRPTVPRETTVGGGAVEGGVNSGVAITQVELLGATGLPQGVFRTGEPVVLRVEWQTERTLDRPLIALALYREDGLYVAQASTEQSGYHTGACQGEVQVEFRWECPLSSGAYRVSASVWESGGRTQLAQAHSAAGFEVETRVGFEGGVLRWEGSWNVRSTPPKSRGEPLSGQPLRHEIQGGRDLP